MRVIDAEKFYKQTAELEAEALDYIKKLDPKEDYEKWIRWTVVLTERTAFKHDVADAPTIDAEPVKHGQWIPTEQTPDFEWECSVCGNGFTNNKLSYCYDCGAKMDEEMIE